MAEPAHPLLLAVNVGTGSVRAAAIAAEGTIVAQAQGASRHATSN